MNPKINRLGKIIFIYYIFKRVKKSKILTKQFSLNKKIKIMKNLTELGIVKFKYRHKP